MNTKSYIGLAIALTVVSMQLSGYAQEVPTADVEVNKAQAKIVAEFADFAGENAVALVEALRTGGSFSYDKEVQQPVLDEQGNPVLVDVVNEDGTVTQVEQTETVIETINVENTAGAQGLGNVKLVLKLAQATLPEGSAYEDIVKALSNSDATGILDLRASGMGWGQIYDSYGLTVGEIMGNGHSKQMDETAKLAKGGKPDKPERVEKALRPEKAKKPDRPEKPEKLNGNGKN